MTVSSTETTEVTVIVEDLPLLESALEETMPEPAMIPVSSVDGSGLDRWLDWLERRIPAAARSAASA